MIVPVCLAASAAGLRLADNLYYRDPGPALRLLRLAPRVEGAPVGAYRPLDPLFCWFPFLWIWGDILLALSLGHIAGLWFAWPPIAVFVGGRMRALQEAAHTALHGGLCRSKRYQWLIADVLAQWPLGRPDMGHRYIGHILEHHRHANELDGDPNIRRLRAVGVVPGMTVAAWRRKLLHPFSIMGLAETARNFVDGVFRKNANSALLPPRLAVMAAFWTLIWAVGGLEGFLLGFLAPLATVYPLFSWISVLTEHRWFVRCDVGDRHIRECENGRPTDYPGAIGALLKHLVFPFTDHHHLAHSLYPALRWSYLPAVDRILKEQDPHYAKFRSVGLFFPSEGRPSALSELRERLTGSEYADVAEWAHDLAAPPTPRLPEAIAT
jgi:fatty acid desaturase